MSLRFFLIEDDPVSRRMLTQLIEETGYGKVCGEAQDGADVAAADLQDIDIVLIDLLMPKRDGIETIRALKQERFNGKFIMISQIENKQMVGAAYQAGVEFFIHKPINRLEVQSILRRVVDTMRLTKSLATIRESLASMEDITEAAPPFSDRQTPEAGGTGEERDPFATRFYGIAGQIGLGGETGAQDIERCLLWMKEAEERGGRMEDLPTLQSLYQHVLSSRERSNREAKAMEQRIRRAVFTVLTHLASLGLSDFANPTFEHYAPRLFEFGEVRQRMKELEKDAGHTKCKVNIRKFLSSLYLEITRHG